jgi:hypothetical protein
VRNFGIVATNAAVAGVAEPATFSWARVKADKIDAMPRATSIELLLL